MQARRKRRFKRSGGFVVYIIRCGDGSYYTGYTNDLKRRLGQHLSGKGGARYTAWKKAAALVWSKAYKRFKPAFLMEQRIKTLTRSQKEALVGGKSLESVFKAARK